MNKLDQKFSNFGSSARGVFDALSHRIAGKDTDREKIALIVEGGALRGVFSCGSAHALAEAGFSNAFDVIIGCSSGALNSLYFEANQMQTAASIYAENATSKECINLRRFPNVLDVDWLISNWILDKKRFDDATVFGGDTPIEVAVTDADVGSLRFFSSRGLSSDFEKSLFATSYTPLACNKKIEIDGRSYSDGLIRAAIPVKRAIEVGCTKAVVLMTREFGYIKNDSLLRRLYGKYRTRDFGEGYRAAFQSQHLDYAEARRLSFEGADDFQTLAIYPSDTSDLVKNLEANEENVWKSFNAGVETTRALIQKLKATQLK
jgi:predicted patatin/cPLA2 family phospholipase